VFIACIVVSVILAFASFGSAMGKLQDVPQMVELLSSVGAEGRGRLLGALQLAGAVGVLVGLAIAPIGIAASIGLLLYYLGAMGAHLRNGHALRQVVFPLPLVLLSAAALWLRIATM